MTTRISTNEVFKIQLSETRLVKLEALMDLSRSVPRIHKKHQVTISPLTIEEEISHLEMTTMTKQSHLEMTTMNDICAICEDQLNETETEIEIEIETKDSNSDINEIETTPKDSTCILNCPHRFHSRCLIQWFKYDPETFSCPLCRQSQKYSGDHARIFYR